MARKSRSSLPVVQEVSSRRGRRRQALACTMEFLERREMLSASWTPLAHAAPSGIHTMLLLSNGTVMSQLGGGTDWAIFTPDASGSYINGTWSRLSSMHDTRTYYSSQVLQDGRVFIAGAEYGSGGSTAEVYDPMTNTWTMTPQSPYGGFVDSISEILPNGTVMVAPVYATPSGTTAIYNPTNNTWSQGPKLYRGGDADEQSWVKLADNSLLSVDGNSTSERFIPSLNQWVNDAAVPVALYDGLGEIGAGVRLADGRAFFLGSTGHTAIYTPTGTTSPGTWVAGPDIPGGLGTDDAPAAVLPDGTVLCAVGPAGTYNGPVTFYTYNPTTNAFSTVSGAPTGGVPYGDRMLDLPDGTVLVNNGGSTLYDYNPAVTAIAGAQPAINSITQNTDGSFLLTGTQLNGISEGAYYGDDAQMNSNYPIVRFTSSGGSVYFARAYNWSSTGVATGSATETTNFTLPLGLPGGTYSVNVMVNGFVSNTVALTTPTVAGDAAPTVATAAAATPGTVTGLTTALSVLGADDAGESNLTYTWANTAAPSGVATASVSINGSNAAKNTTATFQHSGAYTFKVTITDAAGLSTSSSVNVTVNQTLTSVAVTPNVANLTAGATQQLSATGYDQFGVSMSTQPMFTWALTSGGGTVSASGLYTTPTSGTQAVVTATTGSLHASTTIDVLSAPWASADIGSPGVAGYAYDTNGTFTVAGSGSDVWNTSDSGPQYAYRALGGDGTIIARVVTQQNTSGWAKAGVMIRESLNANSAQAFMAITPGNGAAFQYRTATGGSSSNSNTTGFTAPYWVKLVRSGNTITGYRSADGTTWTQQGTATFSMASTVYIGMAVTATNNSALSVVTFDNVKVMAAVSDTIAVAPGNSGTVNVLANDTGPTGTTLSVTGVTQGAKGTVVNNGNGTVTYTATANAVGKDSFSYAISDGIGDTATATVNVTIPGLQAYYQFNEGTGTTTADATGDGYTGTISGATWTTGVQSSSGLAFNGTSSYVGLPALNLNTNTVTISGWVLRNGTQSSWSGLVFSRAGSTTSGLHFGTANELRYTWNGSSSTYNWNSGLVVPNGQWTFVALAVSPTNATLYMDPLGGSMTSAVNAVANAASAFDGATDIGQDPLGGRFFNGSMDEVRIYNTTLSAAAITALANLGPTVATPAAANPSPVAGTTTNLSVLGSSGAGESTLSYAWSATSIPNGATTPTFSINGSNAAKSTLATFTKAGAYTFMATITDSGGFTATSSVNVTVNQTLTAITVTPGTAALASHGTQQFGATGYDQFGTVMTSQPAVTWSNTGSGSVSTSGLYSGVYATSSATVTATSGAVNGSASVTVLNATPTVANAAGASANPVTGTTTNLLVLGADDAGESNLTYSWAATALPAGAAAPTFTINGSNAAKSTTATFSQAGAYTFTATITDAGGASTTSSINVTVNQTLASITVTPGTAALSSHGTQQFSAAGFDQFGQSLVTQPTFTWSSNGAGSVSAAGLYTASYASGAATVTATSGTVSNGASVTVTNATPTVANAAGASANPATGTSTNLSVLGADDAGESNLTYSWAATALPAGATAPTFTINSSNAAKSTTATFSQAGVYTFTATITDAGGASTTSSINVTVNQTLTGITVTPGVANMASHATQQFAATGYDQFGQAITSQPTFAWSSTGSGSVDTNGLYTASYAAGSATVTATSGTVSNSASVTVTNATPTVSNAAAASANPVTGTTTNLSVLGADDAGESNLTYSWVTTALPAGATAPTFTINGSNAAKSTTATFTQAGAYTFTATITDAGGLATTSSITVTVNQTLASMTVTPGTASVNSHGTQQFAATGFDQFGQAITSQPTLNWSSSGAGSVSASGLYTASYASGSATITATSGTVSNSASVTVTNAAPTVSTAAAASANPVTGTTTNLSVLGADDAGESNLTYSWAATTLPAGATAPTFTVNGSNAAKSTTASFTQAGVYAFTATITDAGGLSTTSSINVTVNQMLTSIAVSPGIAAVSSHGTQQFTATANDQFGQALASQPAFTWSSTGAGLVSTSGLYTASYASGSATVTATSGAVSNSASVTVTNATPTVATAAGATPNSVTGTTTTLSVLGADDAGESNLTYSWSATTLPAGAAAPIYSVNGTNAAKGTTATFSKAGTYTFAVTITDAGGLSATSTVNVTVNQTVTSLTVTPAATTVSTNNTRQFSAAASDQFGNAISAPAITWSVASGGGTISTSGLYTAPATVGSATVKAVSGTVSSTAAVTIAAPLQVSLASYYNRIGIYADGKTFSSTGGLDGHGLAMSSSQLGTSVSWSNTTFTIGSAGANDVVKATGQTINVTQGKYTSLKFLATAVNGSQASQIFVVHYTDGTSTTYTQGISDWTATTTYAGESIARTMTYRNRYTGKKVNGTTRLYGYTLALDPTKTIASITLPNNTNVNLFAIALVN
jgi:plastocyanin/regulation of enolase protein 1 (concanavalin A-like superfamily)